MGNALRYGLMNAAMGALKGMQALVEEAKTERLRQARLAEARALQLEDRKYQEEREERLYNLGKQDAEERAKRQREEKLEDYDRSLGDRREDQKTAHQRAIELARLNGEMYGSDSGAEAARVVENIATGEQRELAPGEQIPEGFREVRYGSRYAPARTRERQPSNGRQSTVTNQPMPGTQSFGKPYDKSNKKDWLGQKLGGS